MQTQLPAVHQGYPFSVQHLSQFLQAAYVPHMLAALHVLIYLMNIPAQGILLSASYDLSLLAYSDSDWDACAVSRRSMTGFYVTLGAVQFFGRVRSNPLSLSLQLRLNIEH